MKKLTTAATNWIGKQERLTIGLDLGDRSSHYCVLDESGRIVTESKTATSPKAMEAVFGGMTPEPDRVRNWDAFPVGQPAIEPTWARSHRRACAQCATYWGEPKERRSPGCANLGSASEDRSRVALSGEAPQRESTGRSEPDSSTSWVSAGANCAGEHGTRTGEVVWPVVARMQRAQHESRKSRGSEPGVTGCTAASASGNRSGQRANRRIQRTHRKTRPGELSRGKAAKAGQGRGHTDCADVFAHAGGPASFLQESRCGLLPGTAARAEELRPE